MLRIRTAEMAEVRRGLRKVEVRFEKVKLEGEKGRRRAKAGPMS